MTEEEFKKVIKRVTIFVVIALIILVAVGIVVFGTSKKEKSIFSSQADIDAYKRKVEQITTHELKNLIVKYFNDIDITTEDLEKLNEGDGEEVEVEDGTEETSEGEVTSEEISSEEASTENNENEENYE